MVMVRESLPAGQRQTSPGLVGGERCLTPEEARSEFGERLARTLGYLGEAGTDVTDSDEYALTAEESDTID